ncbi:hypothetical protein [Priestia megaterium]|uniref:hypothetical protein n=1 Tax=Priestia megaterium TaxID=1404 RepID=UPI0039E94A63
MFGEEKRTQIGRTLQEKGVNGPCEKCGHNQFTVLDGYFTYTPQYDLTSVNVGGPNIPTVGVACENCGHISLFAAKRIVPQDF